MAVLVLDPGLAALARDGLQFHPQLLVQLGLCLSPFLGSPAGLRRSDDFANVRSAGRLVVSALRRCVSLRQSETCRCLVAAPDSRRKPAISTDLFPTLNTLDHGASSRQAVDHQSACFCHFCVCKSGIGVRPGIGSPNREVVVVVGVFEGLGTADMGPGAVRLVMSCRPIDVKLTSRVNQRGHRKVSTYTHEEHG